MMTESEQDRRWMERALQLASQSTGLSSPNPAVGCVLTLDGRAIGEGFHQYDLLDHAEVVALKQAGERARGATAYVTLEPCSHQGRTGPCTGALLAAGVTRAVIATNDPNPVVFGKGIAKLRAEGVEVTTGVLEAPARKLNDAFAKFTRTGLPFVTMKVASSLDGRIAHQPVSPSADAMSAVHGGEWQSEPGSGEQSKGARAASPRSPGFWITGEEARAEVHRMRHAADALLVGVGTVLADNPWLTDRSNLPRRRPLLRVVLDSTLRTPLDSNLVTSAHNDLLIVFTRASTAAQRALEQRGVQLQHIPPVGGERVPLQQLMRHLAEHQITNLLVEAGSQVNAAVLNQDLADKLVLFYAPTFLGSDAVPMLSSLAQPKKIERFTLDRFGEDFAFEGYLHDPWSGVTTGVI
jgi:diaminohydroxyphosphoribosylaminopyrimidine deaminase/5-amino-6-(5-phosphoribosylamino)uracil reductase